MKTIKSRLTVFAALAAAPWLANTAAAQDAEGDSVQGQKVHIAYRDIDAGDILGGISYINMEELAKKDYTTYSIEDMNAIIGGWNGNSLWGMDTDNMDNNDSYGVLVFIDGVRRASNNVLPSEIEQVTFLKGAQAVALYGSKAAKGAILITTKRGKVDGIKVEISANTGWHVAKAFPEYLGSAEYMTLYNEARANDGNAPLYTQQDIYNHASGINPYRYTDINYYSSDYVRKAYNRSEATAEIQGGARRARFYTNVSYYRYEDLLDFGVAKDNYTDRFNVRGNVDLLVNDYISAYANANATFYNGRSAKGNFWNAAATMRPNFPQGAAPLIPIDMIDPNAQAALDLISTSSNIFGGCFLGGTQQTRQNDIAAGYASGKSMFTSRQFQFDAGINFDLRAVTKGLSFKTLFAIDYATSYNTSYDNNYAVYIPTWSNYNGKDVIVALTKEGNEERSGNQNVSGTADRQTITWNGHFDYERTFARKHNVQAMLVANMWQTTTNGVYHRYSNANLGLQASYNFDKRYYVDLGVAGVHSARLAEGHRNALSPTASIGWRIGNEQALKDASWIDDLMISASVSRLNEDIDVIMGDKQFYLYEGLWNTAYGYGWNDGVSKQYTYSTQGDNPDLTFIQRKEFSANLRGSFFKKALTIDANFFVNEMSGYLIDDPTFFPSHLATGWPDGSFKPVINNNANKRIGFDFSVYGKAKLGQVEAILGVSGMYYDTKITKHDEIYDKKEAYRYREGNPIDGIWGLESMGLFQSQEEIDAAPTQNFGSTVMPGDIRYKDQNGDGVIDDHDEVCLGKYGTYGAPFTMGVNLTLKYKGFTLFVLGTAGMGAYGVKNNSYYWVSGDGKYSAVVRDRWTPETAATATYPRLSAQTNVNNTYANGNNFRTSDFWMYKSNRFDLAKVQLTYDFPAKVFGNSFVKGLSLYLTGQSLLTISKERELMEMNIGSAPQTRFYNFGVKITM